MICITLVDFREKLLDLALLLGELAFQFLELKSMARGAVAVLAEFL